MLVLGPSLSTGSRIWDVRCSRGFFWPLALRNGVTRCLEVCPRNWGGFGMLVLTHFIEMVMIFLGLINLISGVELNRLLA